MKFCHAGIAAIAGLSLVFAVTASYSQPPATAPSTAQAAPSTKDQAKPAGQVVFSRSIDENGETVTSAGPAAQPSAAKVVDTPQVDDDDRRAVSFTVLDLDVHLHTAEQRMAVRGLLTIRNDGRKPLERVPLQISSSLDWERIGVEGKDTAFTVATLNSDADHTGQLHEAAVPLAEPLAPGGSLRLDVTYSGAIAKNAKRLLAIGTPDDAALSSDWDEIGPEFTGLRGFGNVVWYPVSSVPAILGDGARVFDEIGRHKLRLSGARFTMRLTAEFPAGDAPTVAVIDGHACPLTVTDAVPGQDVPGVATASLGPLTLGFEAPSLFVAARTPRAGGDVKLWTLPENVSAAEAWTAAASSVTPLLQSWLGKRPDSQLTLLDLPDAKDAPFETGALLAVPIRPAAAETLQGVLVHALTHAYLRNGAVAPPAWLDEGVATFMGMLWTEKQQGREKAFESLEGSRPALALAEPASPGESIGQPLANATSPVYYRTKAAYVLWMLRDLAGDTALSAGLRAYAESGANPARKSFEKLIEQSGAQRDLSWFFSDWVDADHGLPDLSIESVFPSAAQADAWLVTVNLANNGYAAAEIPLTVRSAKTSITQRVMIPARGRITQRILIQGRPTQVQLNDGAVPETQASVHVTSLGEPEDSETPGAPQ